MRDIVRGIADYSKEQGDWHLVLHLWGAISESDARWIEKGDGLIFEDTIPTSASSSKEWTVPTVAVQTELLVKNYPLVTSDYAMAGKHAGECLFNKGLSHLAYLSYEEGDTLESGLRAFADTEGLEVSSYYLGRNQPEFDVTAQIGIIIWLSQISPPVGLLVRDDFLAQKVMDWIPVEWIPERLAIIGVGNDWIICELMRPTLTSIDRNARQIGWQAAHILDRILNGEVIPPQTFKVRPGATIERQSTGLSYTADPLITKAIRLFEEEITSPPSTEEIC